MADEPDISDEINETAVTVQNVDKALGNPISLLLGPSARLLGEHWGKKTAAYLNPKQVENLEDKIAIAQADGPLLLGNDTKPRQIAALIEWTDAAHDIDGELQPQLSAAWAKALRDISEQNYTLLDALAKLNEDDVMFLKTGGTLTKEQLTKFIKIGILEAPTSRSAFAYTSSVAFGVLLLAYPVVLFLGSSYVIITNLFGWPNLFSMDQNVGGLVFGILMASVTAYMGVTFGQKIWWNLFGKIIRANISSTGYDIISKIGSSGRTAFYFNKKDVPKEQRRETTF